MGKNTPSPSSDPDAIAAAVDVRHEHLHNQVEDVCDSLSSLETQQASFQKTLDQITTSNTSFQNTMTTQFAAFQSLMLDELRLLKSTHLLPQPFTSVSPVNPTPTRPATSNMQPSFYSLFDPTTTFSGLGLSNTPNSQSRPNPHLHSFYPNPPIPIYHHKSNLLLPAATTFFLYILTPLLHLFFTYFSYIPCYPIPNPCFCTPHTYNPTSLHKHISSR
ncbi:hypothetical protein TB1_004402 [Malus domestica]